MKNIFLATSLLISGKTFAMPAPASIPLDNLAQFGKFVDTNATDIITTSIKLAQVEKPGLSSYYLITDEVSVNANAAGNGVKKPFAIFKMKGQAIECNREVFAEVHADQWGEHRVLTFSLSPSIQCN